MDQKTAVDLSTQKAHLSAIEAAVDSRIVGSSAIATQNTGIGLEDSLITSGGKTDQGPDFQSSQIVVSDKPPHADNSIIE